MRCSSLCTDVHFPELNYDCVQCGKSCGGWRVLVDDASRKRLEQTELARRAPYPPFVECPDGLFRMGFTPENHCVFQRVDRLCSVHAELGEAAKPRTCRQYPFFLVETPDGPFVGLSFCCTAVQLQAGRPASAHRPLLEELLRDGNYPRVGFDPIPFTEGHRLDWPGYLALEAFLHASLEDNWRMLSVPALAALRTPWGASLGSFPEHAPPRNPLLDQLEVLLLAGILGALEGRDLEEMRRVTLTLQSGQSCVIPRVPQPVSFSCPTNPLLEGEIRRYLGHLIHRKFLLLGDTVLSRLAALYLARPVLRFYAAAFAGGAAPELEHLHRAFDVVEGEMLTHAPEIAPYFQAAEDGLLRHL